MTSRSLGISLAATILIISALATGAMAQTSTTGVVTGVVTDPTGAVVPKADVELANQETNAVVRQATNDAGQFVFAGLAPGTYKITVKQAGFRTEALPNLTLDVNKTINVPVKLEVGASSEVVEVTATSTIQLQTSDAQIGNTMETDAILRLPTLQRNATELMNIQPAVVTGGSNLTMRAAGAIDDQNTVTLDGLDITQQVVAGNTVVPTPADSVEEFRVTVLTPNAALVRASGAQVTLVGRTGGNDFHGALYEYLQNSALNSNTWDNNRLGQLKAPIRDNRFGGRIGGPIKKDKTFFFANYEGRRFANVAQITRTVPTDTLKQGILQFNDASGHLVQFNLANAAVCGPNGNAACDPRGIGISPAVKAQWAKMPEPNSPLAGDGLNSSGYFFNLGVPVQTDYGVFRLNHNFSDRVQFSANYTYFRSITTGSGDVGIVNGTPQSFIQNPQRGAVWNASLNYQITPTLMNVLRWGYVRDNNASQATSPTAAAGILNTPGSNTPAGPVALLLGSGVSSFLDSPIDMDTQRARYQANYNGDFQWQDDATKIWGKHTLQFGAQVNMLPYTHVRADKVVGSLASIVATVDGDQSYLTIPSANLPLTCSSTVTANCVTSANSTNWARFYASALGLVDNVNVLAVRDQNLQPLPLGTFLVDHTNEWATYFYLNDSWRVTPSLTLSLGLSYGWQTAPTEQHNLQTVMIYADTGKLIDAQSYMQQRLQSALAGQNFNPTLGFATVAKAGVPVYNIDWHDIAPRAAFAWKPSGKLFGEGKTVLRGGFAIVYDRSNTVQSVEIPMLGVGFDQNIIVQAPLCNATGAGGAGCNASVGTAANPGLASFRVGVDGTLPTPVPTAATSPVIPPPGYTETLSFQVDPNTKVGRSYNVDLTLQRELPGNMIVEAGYLGRFSRHLPQALNLASAPYMMVDSASGQSFAQAYDIIANQLRAGASAASIAAQPFFEDMFPGLAKANNAASATAFIVGRNTSNFTQGNLGTLFINMATYRRSIGLVPLSNDQSQVEFMRTYLGQANYNGGILTLKKTTSHGLSVGANFTYSHALDDNLSNQNNAGFYNNSFHPGVDYGASSFDRHSVFNAYYFYALPVGSGRSFDPHNKILNEIIGGWYTSGIVTMFSGLPITVTESNQVWGGGTATIGASGTMIPTGSIASTGVNGGSAGCTLTGVGNVGTTAATGSGLNLFSNPCAVYGSLRYVQLSSDGRTGRGNPMRGLPVRNMDMRFGKDFPLFTEKRRLSFSADFFNVFNHHSFSNPSLSYTSPTSFGVITSTFTPANRTNSARWIEMGLRLEF
jgi:hypothetical protein